MPGDRYSRQERFWGIGAEGQARLAADPAHAPTSIASTRGATVRRRTLPQGEIEVVDIGVALLGLCVLASTVERVRPSVIEDQSVGVGGASRSGHPSRRSRTKQG